jgi:hypothetical protein
MKRYGISLRFIYAELDTTANCASFAFMLLAGEEATLGTIFKTGFTKILVEATKKGRRPQSSKDWWGYELYAKLVRCHAVFLETIQ